MAHRSEQKWGKIIKETYHNLFHLSIPNCNYDELVTNAYLCSDYSQLPGNSKNGCRKIVYEAYFITEEAENIVFNDIRKKYKLSKSDLQKLHNTIFLGHAPFYLNRNIMDDENNQKFDRVIEKVNSGQIITPDDLFHTKYDTGKWSESVRDLMRLYEYNRKSHPKEAEKYFNLLKERSK